MKRISIFFMLLALSTTGAMASTAHQTAPAVPPMDAPALAALGGYDIGTQRLDVTIPGASSLTAGGVVSTPRTVKVRVWYPAVISKRSVRTHFTHILPQQDGKQSNFSIASLAVEGATPLAEKRYPLIIVSHGYNGWDSFMTWLTENLATKGYIVAAIDHGDARAIAGPELALSFGNVLLHRAADQRATVDYFVGRAANPDDRLGQAIDADNIALIGYSMGGFGALATAGMDYDINSPVFAQLPVDARSAILRSQNDGGSVAARIKAVVALAPFGGSPNVRVWGADTVTRFAKPVLMVDGTEDDIVDAKTGVSWIFNQMSANNRHLLLFQNARHNIGGNPPPPEAFSDFSTYEYFAEPVWRTERINAINQHFITAFLDLNLKNDTAKAAYLDVTPTKSADGQWPIAPFTNVGGRHAADSEPGYWRGFQRRWAVGLEMHHGEPAQAPR